MHAATIALGPHLVVKQQCVRRRLRQEGNEGREEGRREGRRGGKAI